MIIDVYENTLSSQFCNHCIWKFERDVRKGQGLIGGGYINTDIKDSMDLSLSSFPDWEKEDRIFYNTLKKYTKEHSEKYPFPSQDFESYFDTGYQIQRTNPESVGYTWHHDFVVTREDTGAVAVRVLTYIWYLNTIDHGGYTEFANGESVKPETGKLLLFPADWSHVHRGIPPRDKDKYICTGWIYSRF